ncbi:CRISPR-associated helicase Cas3' [Paracoccus zhejiangensis]|nr:CRISPR-associated helicase Cas3' [Paracoccus zhejiangensis]
MQSVAWGKLDGTGGRHTLTAHSADVAMVFEALVALPEFRRALAAAAGGAVSDAAVRRLVALTFIHDIGKLHPAFQSKARGGSERISHSSAGCGLLGLAAREAAHPLKLLAARLFQRDARMMPYLAAVFAHHGKPVEPSHRAPGQWPGQAWMADAADYQAFFDAAFPDLEPAPLPEAAAFQHLYAGLLALADWIGSDRDFFPFEAEPDADYLVTSRARAEHALRQIGLDRQVAGLPDADFGRMTGFSPSAAQAAIAEISPDARLAILEAETGSGKTEAALWHFARLSAAGKVSGLYFAVPTRAAARQLHRRVCLAVRNLFGDAAPEPVLAIPGQRVAGEATGRALPDFVTVWDDAEEPVKSRWAAEHATRFLAASVAVGTVDQAMLAALQVKHAHLRGAALSRSLLVIDEVHASDSYMTVINQALLRAHLGAGGHAFLMSATLGAVARSAYLGQPCPSADEGRAAPFPALWVPGAPVIRIAPGQDKQIGLTAVDSMAADEMAGRAIAAAGQGARVLVIRNTVGAAAECWRAVQEAGRADLLLQVAGAPALHHARFAAEDRALLDRAVEAALAPDLAAGSGCIVIGTQTLEQSLDIDADVLLTDLCPMDVLLQRLGRLHRHARPRPQGFAAARALVFCPEGGLDRLAGRNYENGLGSAPTCPPSARLGHLV